MKPLAALTYEDLISCPVWLYHGPTDDVAQVSAAPGANLTDNPSSTGGTYIALSEFKLANGRTYPGYSSPADPSGLDYIQPVLLANDRHLRLCNENGELIDAGWTQLGFARGETFPISWRCLVPVDGKVVGGQI